MTIRKAAIDDIDILIKLRIDYLTEDFGLTQSEEAAIRSQLAEFIPRHIGQDFFAVIAEEDSLAVSTAFLSVSEKPANPACITGRSGTTLNVFTYPEYRRLGFATKVLNAIIDEAKQRQLSFIDLSASPAGKPLYERLGFEEPHTKFNAMRLNLLT